MSPHRSSLPRLPQGLLISIPFTTAPYTKPGTPMPCTVNTELCTMQLHRYILTTVLITQPVGHVATVAAVDVASYYS